MRRRSALTSIMIGEELGIAATIMIIIIAIITSNHHSRDRSVIIIIIMISIRKEGASLIGVEDSR